MRIYKFKKILAWLVKHYSPDVRALSLMRIGVALLVIIDLIIRSGDLSAHYTDEGIWPTRLVATFMGKPGAWSMHALSGSYLWIVSLFAVHFIAAFFLLAGYKTRLSGLIVWLLTISLQNRNIYVLQGGDDLLRLLLFWGLFLPWNRHYSVDSRHIKFRKANFTAGIGYFLLIASVYFFTVSLKESTEWRNEGSAVYYALSLDQLRLPLFGDLLYRFPGLMKIFTHLVFCIELAAPLLILWPSNSGRTRFAAFLLIITMHAGIGLTLYVGLFFAINMVSAIGLLPAGVMDRIDRRLPKIGRPVQQQSKIKNKFRPLTNLVCATAIVLSLIINLSGLRWFSYELKSEMSYVVNAVRLDQYWGMFSPTVLKKDGWYVFYGTDSIGRQWDLRLNQDYVDFKKPEHIVRHYRTDRWRKLAENMQSDNYTFLRPLYCKYILRQWNKEHPEKKIVTLNLYFMEENSLPGYRASEIKKNLFCVCNDI